MGPSGDEKEDEEEDIHWQQRIRERDQLGMTQQCALLGRALGCPGNVWDRERLSRQTRGRKPSETFRQKE